MDEFFNHDVADWITKSMSRMDDDEAEMFARFFVYEVHKQDIENNRRTLDAHVEEVNKSLMADLRPEVREVVSKAMVSKADFATNWGDVNQQEQPRGPRGQWIRIGSEGKGKKAKTIGYHPDVGVFRIQHADGKVKGQKAKIDITGALNQTGEAGSSFSQRWTEARPNDYKTNERTYRRVAAGAELLGNIPGAGPKAQLASQVGQFAGQFGPEAEKVIGPAARRTAYRYRGTERQPDKDLGKWQVSAEEHLKKVAFTDDQRNSAHPPELDEEQKMEAAELAAQQYLARKLPTPRLAELHASSGKIPPSQGVIISDKGEIVTQAVGFQEDHYLPFNLKNLKGLQGGSYVRSRSSGGLTSEDIYTGLIAGARSVTVVSRSGVFTIDFDDHLRGGRRYSDKARQMVGRYAQTLDAVKSGKVAQRKLDPGERAEIREEVETEMEGQGYSRTQIEAKVKEKEREFTSNPRLTKAEINEIEDNAKELTLAYDAGKISQGSDRMPSDPKMRYKAYYSELYDAAMEGKAKRMYQLDADGYEAAMHALQEQFPYFVARVQAKKFPKGGSEKDVGYVRPHYNRPEGAKEGYYDPKIQGYESKQKGYEGTGKFSASDMHYQNARYADRVEGSTEGTTAEGAKKSDLPAGAKYKEAQRRVAMTNRSNAAVEGWAKAGAEAYATLDPSNRGPYQLTKRFQENPDIKQFSPQEIVALRTELNDMQGLLARGGVPYANSLAKMQQAKSAVDRTERAVKASIPFDEDAWDANPQASQIPQRWNMTAAHTENAGDPAIYQREFDQTLHKYDIKNEISAGDTDADMYREEQKWVSLVNAAKTAGKNPGNDTARLALEEAMVESGANQAQLNTMNDALDSGDIKPLKHEYDRARKKALGIIRARSTKAAAEASTAPPPTPPPAQAATGGSPPNPSPAPAQASAAGAATPTAAPKLVATPVSGSSVPKPAPPKGPIHASPAPASSHYKAQTAPSGGLSNQDILDDIDDSLASGGLEGAELAAFKRVHAAFQGTDQAEQHEAVEQLAGVNAGYADILRRHLNAAEPTHGAATQLSGEYFKSTAQNIRNWVDNPHMSSELTQREKTTLRHLASAIEDGEMESITNLAADIPWEDEKFANFTENNHEDVKLIIQSFQ